MNNKNVKINGISLYLPTEKAAKAADCIAYEWGASDTTIYCDEETGAKSVEFSWDNMTIENVSQFVSEIENYWN